MNKPVGNSFMSISWLFESHPAPGQLVSGGGTNGCPSGHPALHCLSAYVCIGISHPFQLSFHSLLDTSAKLKETESCMTPRAHG